MAVVSLADIQNFAAELAREFSPEKVILFGSHSWGKPDDDSDVDLLVITQFEGEAVAVRRRDQGPDQTENPP